MAILNIPHKNPGDQLLADEANQLVDSNNEIHAAANRASHAFSEEHFKINGTVTVDGVAYPVIDLRLNPAHFEIVDGNISIRANLLA